MSNLPRQIEVAVNSNVYNVKFPNSGEIMDIELLKLQITNGRYDTLKFSINPMFQAQALKVDAVAFFNIMVPGLKKDLTTKSLFDLEEEQLNVIVKQYEDVVLPWYEEWMTVLSNPVSQEGNQKS